jgi:hypothetical protein
MWARGVPSKLERHQLRLMMKIYKHHQLARRSFSGDRPPNCHHPRCFPLGVENGGFSGSTGNFTIGLEKPFQSLARLMPAVSVFQRLGPPTLLPRIFKGIAKQHFVEFNGRPVKSVKTAFKKAISLSGLEGRISPHTLRPTAATWLMQIGVSTWEAAGFLGMPEKTLRDVYGHHHPDYLQGAAKAIGARKPVSLVNSLVKLQPRRRLSVQRIEKIGGGRSRSRTCLYSQIPC